MTVLSQTSAESDKSNNPWYNLFEANINFLSDYQKTEVKKIKRHHFPTNDEFKVHSQRLIMRMARNCLRIFYIMFYIDLFFSSYFNRH